MRIYLEVPYIDKDIVRELGAWYDGDEKKWHIDDRQDRSKFERWIPVTKEQAINTHKCAISGCNAPGSLSHATDGSGPWLCSRHFFNRSESGESLTPEQRLENLEEISRLMRNFAAQPKPDPKDWARKIIDRAKNGDQTVSSISYRTACEALGLTNA
jgi:hypothetical protein